MSWRTSRLRMKPPCVVKPLHLGSPKAPRSRKRRRDSCFHNLNGYDGPTMNQRIPNPDLWDAYGALYAFRIDPILHSRLRCDSAFGGWNCDSDFTQLVHAMETERQFEKRY